MICPLRPNNGVTSPNDLLTTGEFSGSIRNGGATYAKSWDGEVLALKSDGPFNNLSIDLRRRGEERSLEFVGVLGTAVRGLPSCRALDELRGK